MKNRKFISIFFQYHYYRGAYTGDGFKIRINMAKYGLIFRIYWGPYKDSQHLILFIGIDQSVLLERKVNKLMKNLSPKKRLALTKALLEIEKPRPE